MNHWEKKHGANRRMIDKKLLADLEKKIADEENLRAELARLPERHLRFLAEVA